MCSSQLRLITTNLLATTQVEHMNTSNNSSRFSHFEHMILTNANKPKTSKNAILANTSPFQHNIFFAQFFFFPNRKVGGDWLFYMLVIAAAMSRLTHFMAELCTNSFFLQVCIFVHICTYMCIYMYCAFICMYMYINCIYITYIVCICT